MFQNNEKDYTSKLTEDVILNNFKTVAEMKPVGVADEDVLSQYGDIKLHEKIVNFFNDLGEVSISGLYGKYNLNKKSAIKIANHHFSRLVGYAIGQIDKVLKEGKAIFYESKYNGKSFDRILIAAPIDLLKNDKKNSYIMGVAVNLSKNSIINNIVIHIIEEGQALHIPSTIDKQLPNNGLARPSIVRLLQEVIAVKNGTMTLDQVTAIGIDSK